MSIFAAEEFHDIAPPIDYSLIAPWVVFVAAFIGLSIIGLIAWLIVRSRKRTTPRQSPRERALELLDRMQGDVEKMQPYRFSIRVSDILRRYVTEQYNLPVTRQTSVEFLNALTTSSPFSDEERTLLRAGRENSAGSAARVTCNLHRCTRASAARQESHPNRSKRDRYYARARCFRIDAHERFHNRRPGGDTRGCDPRSDTEIYRRPAQRSHRYHCICRASVCRESNDLGSRLASAKSGESTNRPCSRRRRHWISDGGGGQSAER